MAKPLVIVESPAKAKTLGRFLGSKYRVEASYGHIRDLPESAAEVPKEIKKKEWGRLGVDVESDFTPYYVVPNDKKKQVAHLKTAVKEASELLLATDPDREGEAISWHLTEVLKPKVPVHRIVFHALTAEAVREAPATPGKVNEDLEESADGVERGARPERRGQADRRAGGRAPRVPHGGLLGSRGEAAGRGTRVRR